MRQRWRESIYLGDIFQNEEMSFEEIRNEIVRRIKRTRWYKRADEEDTSLYPYVEELSETKDENHFNQIWDAIYDEADADRVWIDTFRSAAL